jgi:hypothetical protein
MMCLASTAFRLGRCHWALIGCGSSNYWDLIGLSRSPILVASKSYRTGINPYFFAALIQYSSEAGYVLVNIAAWNKGRVIIVGFVLDPCGLGARAVAAHFFTGSISGFGSIAVLSFNMY